MRIRAILAFVSISFLPVPSRGAAVSQDAHADHAAAATPPAAAVPAPPRDPNLPPSENQAKAQLDHTPRHGEYADVRMPSGGAAIRTWVSYPERSDKAGVVIVIHEVFGLSDWIRSVADQLAREGFIAVAPDLVSGKGPNGGGTESAGGRDEAVKLVRTLSPEEATARIEAVREWAIKLPAANGKTATIGFCWGGGQSFSFAVAQPALNGAVVFYGTPPDEAGLVKIAAPVLGFYGGDDARVTSTVAPTEAQMKKVSKSYEPHVFAGAGHGFLRAQDDRGGANRKATSEAWPRTIAFLKAQLK